MDKSYKNQAITFGIIAGVMTIVAVIVTWKWMQLRKNVAKVATGTKTPTTSSVSAAIDTINSQANSLV